ncbi:MAG: dicarboxylate/amino acid:cation symporter [Acidobacteria bacterium]|nr:dicarboxylate/amino acid:cation symporter [Acidobacteriota bacterium]
MKQHTKILIGLLAGALCGVASQVSGGDWIARALISIEPLGTLFINLILMVVVPLIVGSVFVAMASLGERRRLGTLGGRTLGFFLTTTMIGAVIGMSVALLVRPGEGLDPAIRDGLAAQFEGNASRAAAANAAPGLIQLLLSMIPQNPFGAAARMELLPLVICTLIFGAAASQIPEERRQGMVRFFTGLNDTCMVVISWVMTLAPYAVFTLIGAMVARFGVDLLRHLIVYCLVVVAGLSLHLVVLAVAVRWLARMKVFDFVRGAAKALLVAFSTSSSSATLPVSIEVATKNLGVPAEVAAFVLPLGTTLNLNGAAVYKGATAVFIALVYGISLGPATCVTIVFAATLAAITGAGVPGSSLVTTLVVLNAIGLGPHAVSGIALVLGVDRLLDMLRTTVNLTSSLTCAVYVGRCEQRADVPVQSSSGAPRSHS